SGRGICSTRPRRVRLSAAPGDEELEGRGRFPVDALAALRRVGRLCEEPLLLWRYGQEVEAIKPKIERRRAPPRTAPANTRRWCRGRRPRRSYGGNWRSGSWPLQPKGHAS